MILSILFANKLYNTMSTHKCFVFIKFNFSNQTWIYGIVHPQPHTQPIPTPNELRSAAYGRCGHQICCKAIPHPQSPSFACSQSPFTRPHPKRTQVSCLRQMRAPNLLQSYPTSTIPILRLLPVAFYPPPPPNKVRSAAYSRCRHQTYCKAIPHFLAPLCPQSPLTLTPTPEYFS